MLTIIRGLSTQSHDEHIEHGHILNILILQRIDKLVVILGVGVDSARAVWCDCGGSINRVRKVTALRANVASHLVVDKHCVLRQGLEIIVAGGCSH